MSQARIRCLRRLLCISTTEPFIPSRTAYLKSRLSSSTLIPRASSPSVPDTYGDGYGCRLRGSEAHETLMFQVRRVGKSTLGDPRAVEPMCQRFSQQWKVQVRGLAWEKKKVQSRQPSRDDEVAEQKGGQGAERPGSEGGSGMQWFLYGGAALAVYAAGVYLSMLMFGGESGKEEGVGEAMRRRAYDLGASTYESDVCSGEWWMGITSLRKQLLKLAKGEVLEVAAGTGHNFPMYPSDCFITAGDCSLPMVEIAKKRAEEIQDQGAKIAAVVVMDAENLKYPNNCFDTVVDTFGLCSFEDPVKSLMEMKRVCRKEGQILLLEHGRSSWSAVSRLLDRSAKQHACRWGCWWNRNIEEIVQKAGLQIVEIRKVHLGTTYFIVAKPA